MSEPQSQNKRARPCPICKKMSIEAYHPFCSKKCADVDLGRWLGGKYAIPTEEKPIASSEEEAGSES